MILKITINQRISKDMNWSLSTEVIADSQTEAEQQGRDFLELMEAFRIGMAGADLEEK